uniref:Uncharacterized protein n=1 Tax=Anguilla anguilla TaxID=7936 RepID=A0A0E9T2A6_ANGAN
MQCDAAYESEQSTNSPGLKKQCVLCCYTEPHRRQEQTENRMSGSLAITWCAILLFNDSWHQLFYFLWVNNCSSQRHSLSQVFWLLWNCAGRFPMNHRCVLIPTSSFHFRASSQIESTVPY